MKPKLKTILCQRPGTINRNFPLTELHHIKSPHFLRQSLLWHLLSDTFHQIRTFQNGWLMGGKWTPIAKIIECNPNRMLPGIVFLFGGKCWLKTRQKYERWTPTVLLCVNWLCENVLIDSNTWVQYFSQDNFMELGNLMRICVLFYLTFGQKNHSEANTVKLKQRSKGSEWHFYHWLKLHFRSTANEYPGIHSIKIITDSPYMQNYNNCFCLLFLSESLIDFPFCIQIRGSTWDVLWIPSILCWKQVFTLQRQLPRHCIIYNGCVCSFFA